CFVRLYFICGSGKVIHISSTSFSSKRKSTSSIWVRKKPTFFRFSSKAIFAPRHKRAPLMSMPKKFFSGYFFARFTVCSPLPQPNSKTIGLLFLKKFLRQFPFKFVRLPKTSSLVG